MLNIEYWKDWQVVLLILIILLPLYTINLGTNSLWDLDEGVYSEISREMVLRDDYINTYFNFEPRFDKPPLILWVTAFFYSIFGVSELTTRIGPVIFGFLNIVILYYFAKLLFNRRTAIITGLILGTSFQYLIQSRILYMDVPLTFFITTSLFLFYLGISKDRKYYILMGLTMASGTLTKGPIAIGLPGLIVLFYIGPISLIKEFKYLKTWLSVLLYFLIVLPWHVIIYINHGNKFLTEYFGYHMLTRFSTAIETHGGPWYYYIFVLFLGLFPWSAFIPWIIPMIKNNWKGNRDKYRLLIIWIFVILVFFSIASTKLPGYILSAYPAFALLIAAWWDRLIKTGKGIRKLLVSNTILILIGVIMIFGLNYIRPMVERDLREYLKVLDILFYFPNIFIAGGIISYSVYFWKEKKYRSLVTYITVAYIILVLIIALVMPLAEEFKPVKTLAGALPTNITNEVKVLSSLEMEPASLVFYSKTKIYYIKDIDKLKDYLRANEFVYAFLDDEDYNKIKDDFKHLEIIKTYRDILVIKNFKGVK